MPDPRPLTPNEYDIRRGQDISEAERQRRIDFEKYLTNMLGDDRGNLSRELEYYFNNNRGRTENFYNTATSPLEVEGAQGFSPEARAALNAQAIDSVPGRYDSMISNLKTALSKRGGLSGATGASGMYGSLLAKILGEKEQYRTDLLRKNVLSEEDLKNKQLEQNRGFALNQRGQQLSGIGGALNATSAMANNAYQFYNPGQYIPGIASTMSNPGFPIRPPEPQGRGFWGTLAGALGGAASNFFSGKSLFADRPGSSGGSGGEWTPEFPN